MSDFNITVQQVRLAVQKAMQHPQFIKFQPPLEEQLMRGFENKKVTWSADVSNGCRQASVPAYITIEV